MLILHFSVLGTAPCWGVHLQKKGMKWRGSGDDEWDWGEEGHFLIPSLVSSEVHNSPPNQPKCRVALMSWHCFQLQNTSPCCLAHPLPHFLKSTALQPWVSATGASKYGRLFRELVIVSWNWPGHNGEGCQILGTPFQTCMSQNRSFWLSFPNLSSAPFLFLGQDKRRLWMEQIG